MSQIVGPSNVVFVIDGTTPAPQSLAAAHSLLGPDVHWTVVSVVAEHPRLTTGATGFAGPVLSPDTMDSIATADIVAGDAATAATARGLGDSPVTQYVVRGHLGRAIAEYVDEHGADLVVVDSPDLAKPLVECGLDAVLVINAHA